MEAATEQAPVLADATPQAAPEVNEPTEAYEESPDAFGAAGTGNGIAATEETPSTPLEPEPSEVLDREPAGAYGTDVAAASPTEPLPNDTIEPPASYGGEPAKMPNRDDQSVTRFVNDRVTTPEEFAPTTPAEPAPMIAAEPPSNSTGQTQPWGGQPIAVPGGLTGTVPGQVVVVLVMPPGGGAIGVGAAAGIRSTPGGSPTAGQPAGIDRLLRLRRTELRLAFCRRT